MSGLRREPIEELVPGDDPRAEGEGDIDEPVDAGDDEAPVADELADDVEGEVDAEEPPEDAAQALVEELERVNDRYLRLAAEFENFRKRTRREQAELSVVAQADLARRLLPTLDDLSRVSSIPPESTTVEALDAGLDLILRNLNKELEEAGLVRIEAMGERFNPEVHQALMTADTADPDLDDTVSRVLVDGYVFRDRLVRPAQVEVLNFSTEGAEEG